MLRDRLRCGGVALSIVTACSPQTRDPAELAVESSWGTWRVAARDSTSMCADVGELRVCWPEAPGAVPVSVVGRPTPPLEPASRLGWRCTGSGAERTCRDRNTEVGTFVCAGAHCVEPHPRFPDDGEWTCAEMAGSVVCTGGDLASGVASSEPDPGFRCGPRRGPRARPGERVCVDFAPDFPDGSAAGWRCRYEHDGLPRRICERATGEHALADTCSAALPCVDGSVCVAKHCLPLTPSPECWLDADCATGACRFGSCTATDAPHTASTALPAPVASRPSTSVVLRASDADIDVGRVRAQPASAVRRATSMPGALVVEVDRRALVGDLELDVGGACPVRVSPQELDRSSRIERDLAPRVTVDAPDGPIGPDRTFTIQLTPHCAEIDDVTWNEISGSALRAAVVDEQGRHFSARTPTLDALVSGRPWGIVPVSAASRGLSVIEVRWSDGDRRERRRVSITTLARNRGLPSLAVNTPFVLGGTGWHVGEAPGGAPPSVTPIGVDAASVTLRQSGRYVLVDGANRRVRVSASGYGETPLDCGRGDCHASEAAAASATRMTSVLASGLNGAFGRYDPACAIACHATGEPGSHDGGFADVASELGFDPGARTDWDALPRDLRRLGGVGCLACHGPGAIPEPDARWAILRTGVCATCHDAPPRYGHVAAWRTTRMARADADARTRAEPCARCHTTSGALSMGTAPPVEVGGIGLGCVVCHAVHGDPPRDRPKSPERLLHGPALLRDAIVPTPLGDVQSTSAAPSAVCMSCHFPSDGAPWASAAALWAGRGGLDPESDGALDGTAPHRDLAGGCLACHGGGPAGLERGAGHGFAADRAECLLCHAALPPRADLVGRARTLLGRLSERGAVQDAGASPPHARARALKTTTPLGRAAYDVLLVLEDPAAADHNPTYASALLDAAERALRSR